jgi:hypothetical protein
VAEEVAQRAREADLRLDRLHLGPDACDLGEADLVDLPGCLRRSRELPGEEGIALLPAARLGPADTVRTARQVLGFEECLQPRKGGLHFRPHGVAAGFGQPRTL